MPVAVANSGVMTVVQPQSYFFEDLELGMEASLSRTVKEADIAAFAEVSGDHNPVHVDAAYAAQSKFGERVSHGMLTASYISAIFGMKMPGPGAIYVSQTLNFRRPVKIGDEIATTVEINDLWPEKCRARFQCRCVNTEGKTVLEGEAILLVPSRAVAATS